jgi:membrane-bound metal-dependent hydrolase YbcI (DUF457 family)
MMARGHALSGALLALGGAAALHHTTGVHLDPAHLALFTTATAGAALLPDLDVQGAVLRGKGAAVAGRTFGRASMVVAEGTCRISARIHNATLGPGDKRSSNGHRTFTHTWVACLLAGLVTTGLTLLPGRAGWIATLALVFITVGLAVRGLLGKRAARHGWIGTALVAAAVTGTAAVAVLPHRWPAIGLAIGLGCIAHTLGDVMTDAGAPVLWPLPIRGQLWYPIGTIPRVLRFKAGHRVERWLVTPALVLATIGAIALTTHNS